MTVTLVSRILDGKGVPASVSGEALDRILAVCKLCDNGIPTCGTVAETAKAVCKVALYWSKLCELILVDPSSEFIMVLLDASDVVTSKLREAMDAFRAEDAAAAAAFASGVRSGEIDLDDDDDNDDDDTDDDKGG